MTLLANTQQAAAPWGVDAVYVCFGTEGGPYTGVSASSGLPVNIVAGGGSGGTASSFAAAFPATGTAVGFKDTGGNMAAGLLDASGFLKVNVAAGSGSNPAAGTTGAAVPGSADYTGVNVGGNLRGQTGVNPSGSIYAGQMDVASIAGTTADTNSGNKSAGTQRIVIATDQPALTNALKVDGSAITQPVSGIFWQAAQPVTQSGTWTVQPGNTQNTTAWLVTQTPATSGGCSSYSVNSSGAANQDAAAIKASAGQLYGWSIQNTTSSARYVKFYNLASGATSASTPALRLYLPPTGGNNMTLNSGIVFGTGISVRITTGAADNDTGACSANDVLLNAIYK
jgi:hypothetical protein